jgi:hypothetical protein
MVGFTDISDESRFMDEINSGKREVILATHVLQYVFLGFTGFRFPSFHFPTKQATACELNVLFWKIINLLLVFGFKIKYISMDEAQTNRDFAKNFLGSTEYIFIFNSEYRYICHYGLFTYNEKDKKQYPQKW